ncbi:class I SAM-dependent methyltransferase [Streptomyces sp. 7N604]|uniref:class I SAM-dependent methyltransferase n=1 Tax=Streptomyces sp. 7N604 TaxID=3457415 RepID=UPI003FD0D040
MAFSHNRHYHRLLLRHVPRGCGTALDAGCGRGEFAEKLASRSGRVDAFDLDQGMAEAAAERTARMGNVRVQQGDLRETHAAGSGTYDYVACVSTIHHVPFEEGATALRAALAPGGTLVLLGLYRPVTLSDWGLSLAAVPVNAVCRAAHAIARTPPQGTMPVREAGESLAEIRRAAATALPGARIRRLLFWRYVLVYREP